MLRILIYGNSIFLAGLAASLSRRPGWAVTQQRGDLTTLGAPPGSKDVVIVDAAQTGEALAQLQPYPAWHLFSVDMATGVLTAYAAQSHLVQEMAEIEQVIHQIAETSAPTAADSPPETAWSLTT